MQPRKLVITLLMLALAAGSGLFAAQSHSKSPAHSSQKKSSSTPPSAKKKTSTTANHSKSGTTTKSAKSRTRSASHSSRKGKSRPAPRYVQSAPSPERYMDIQRALAEKGYYTGEVNGRWDADSIDALRRFQKDQNLQPDGKISSLSLIGLGLGPKREPSGDLAAKPAAEPPPNNP